MLIQHLGAEIICVVISVYLKTVAPRRGSEVLSWSQ